jgi:hypothetical protein
VESFDDPEHEFALRSSAKQAGGVIAALTAKSVLEVSPQTAPVSVLSAKDRNNGSHIQHSSAFPYSCALSSDEYDLASFEEALLRIPQQAVRNWKASQGSGDAGDRPLRCLVG